jgi:hypothetical protein
MATIGLARLLPRPQHSYAVQSDDPSPATRALQVIFWVPRLPRVYGRVFANL